MPTAIQWHYLSLLYYYVHIIQSIFMCAVQESNRAPYVRSGRHLFYLWNSLYSNNLLFSFQPRFHALFPLSASTPRSSFTLVRSWSLTVVPNTPTSPLPPRGLSTAIGPNIPSGEGMPPTSSYPPRISTISDLSPSINEVRSISPSDLPSLRPESARSPFPATSPIRSPSSPPYLFPGLPSFPASSFHLCPSSLLHPRCLPPRFAMSMPSAHRGLPHRPSHLRMVAPCRPLPGRPRPLWLHARPPRSTALTPRQPMTPALEPSHRGVVLPGLLPGSLITDPSLPSSFSTLSLSLPLCQPLRYSGLLSRSALPAPRDLQPLLGPFPPSSWSNAASLRANDPDLADVANRLSSPLLPSFPASRCACCLLCR